MPMLDGARSLWELIEQRVAATPDRVMLHDGDRRTTFADYQAMVERAAAGLHAMGIGADDHVSWQLPTWTESAVLVGALGRLGAIQNPMLPIYRYREVSFIAKQTGCKLLITPSVWNNFDYAALAEQVAGENDGMHALVADHWNPDGDPATLPPAPAVFDDRAKDPVRWIFYTSGTTAAPKGAQHTDRSAIARCDRVLGEDARGRRRHCARGVPVHAHRRHHHRGLHAATHRVGRGLDGGVDAASINGADRQAPDHARERRGRDPHRADRRSEATPRRVQDGARLPGWGLDQAAAPARRTRSASCPARSVRLRATA